MGFSSVNIAVENAFATAWGSTTTVRYDNNPFTIPSTSWVSLSVYPGKTNKASAGTGTQLRRMIGTVRIDIYTPINGAVKPAADLADSVVSVFRDLVVSGITFYEATLSRIGEQYYSASGTGVSSTTKWYQITVAIPFRYDSYV